MIDLINVAQAATLPVIKYGDNLGVFIKNIYSFAIGLVGLAVFVQFLIAGFSYFLAAGNVAEVGNAKSRMQNAILGGILLLSSYLILNVINPDFVNVSFNMPTLPPAPQSGSVPKGTVSTETYTDREAKILLDEAGIDVASGVSLEGVKRETITAVIIAINGCNTLDGDNDCDLITITQGVEYTGSTRFSSASYTNGCSLGVDEGSLEVDLEDYLESATNTYRKVDNYSTIQQEHQHIQFGYNWVGRNGNDWEVNINC